MIGSEVRLIASGRTDAGVHALHQTCNFRTVTSIPPDSLRKGLNALLPDDIFIKDAEYVSLDFHSRYHCKSKMYEYRILNRKDPDIFLRRLCLAYPATIEYQRHITLRGRSRGNSGIFPVSNQPEAEIPIPSERSLLAELAGEKEDLLFFRIKANGFLRHMVRNIVGTLIDVGLEKTTPAQFKEILDSRDRQMAGMKAPPQGLFLVEVNY